MPIRLLVFAVVTGLMLAGGLVPFHPWVAGASHRGRAIGTGDYFGESGLLTGEPLNGQVTALTRAVIYEISKVDRYLNNIVEQDHRAIKRRCAPMLALKTFRTAAVTLAGVELAHRIRKRQFSFGRGGPRRFSSLKSLWARALARLDPETDRGKPAVVRLSRHGTRTQVLAC